MTDHPAPFSRALIPHLVEACRGYPGGKMLDPFAGIGRGAEIADAVGMTFLGVEIEPEWAASAIHVVHGDSTEVLPWFEPESFDVVCTSPAYGNRMADRYLGSPKDAELGGRPRRRSYAIFLGRKPSAGSSGGMHWGQEYRDLHEKVWAECVRLLAPGGRFVLNCSDFIAKKNLVSVTQWHENCLVRLGLEVVDRRPIETRRFKDGQNRDARVPHEWIISFGRPPE